MCGHAVRLLPASITTTPPSHSSRPCCLGLVLAGRELRQAGGVHHVRPGLPPLAGGGHGPPGRSCAHVLARLRPPVLLCFSGRHQSSSCVNPWLGSFCERSHPSSAARRRVPGQETANMLWLALVGLTDHLVHNRIKGGARRRLCSVMWAVVTGFGGSHGQAPPTAPRPCHPHTHPPSAPCCVSTPAPRSHFRLPARLASPRSRKVRGVLPALRGVHQQRRPPGLPGAGPQRSAGATCWSGVHVAMPQLCGRMHNSSPAPLAVGWGWVHHSLHSTPGSSPVPHQLCHPQEEREVADGDGVTVLNNQITCRIL